MTSATLRIPGRRRNVPARGHAQEDGALCFAVPDDLARMWEESYEVMLELTLWVDSDNPCDGWADVGNSDLRFIQKRSYEIQGKGT